MTQKMNCYVCEKCGVVIGYGNAPTPAPHYCERCRAKEK